MAALVAFAVGLVFGIGLLVSGMTDPGKVLGFLDLAGAWDPSLAVVMATAVPVAASGYAIGRRRFAPLAAPSFTTPAAGPLDRRLVLGSIAFGVGWGLVGMCPGPAIVVAATGAWQGLLFVAAMVAGMLAFEAIERMRATRAAAPAPSSPTHPSTP